ncbi:efflux RND transporter permease subunit [Bermanella marisrubri]|uniref:AcrB/AcrD/AcrF family protein n=1 Tax=Bermanella marisrubri TaxID=207949 RepID=Q1N1D5_9GAMM|nr:efflux RND transporter permease subunit [Bermanella marisrubri]EAT12115.1 AcrB/AcrD/AcrF family protein [Oceanobacter sp. RED65] [Bermanella marisrubri]QIZ83578.1 efflux RND transporter permease subunit [Bermanella marisrubri]
MSIDPPQQKGIIAWFASNPVAANLLMIFIIIGGLFSALTIQKQMFPQLEFNWISINVAYPGAGPQEVEIGITEKVEESLQGVQGIDRLITYSYRNLSQAWIKVDDDFDTREVLDEVKVNVEGIQTLPDRAERPLIIQEKYTQEVMYIALYGELPFAKIKQLGEEIHTEIQDLPIVQVSEYFSGPDYEISIELSRDKIREYDLSFSEVADRIQRFSANLSAGEIRTDNGYIGIRVENQGYNQLDFERIPLRTNPDGSQLFVADVAEVKDGFTEGLRYGKFNGQEAVIIFIGASNNQSTPDVAKAVKKYIADKQSELPPTMKLESWVDLTYYLEGRLDMMMENMWTAAILVFIMLALFLRLKLAMWVMVGLPVCFLGTLMLMPISMIDVTISLTSLFGFILVLGIVVDDAIVIGESVHTQVEKHGQSLQSVVSGAQKVAMPATFGVLTTVAAFLPMLFGDGPEAAIAKSIGVVVILCLLFSLVESKFILPAHLASMKPKDKTKKSRIYQIQDKVDTSLKNFIDNRYAPALGQSIKHRYIVLASFLALLLITIGLVRGDFVKVIGTPKVPHDFPEIMLTMTPDTGEQATLNAALAIERMIKQEDQRIQDEFGQSMIRSLYVELSSRTEAKLMITLVEPEQRVMDTFALSDRWRKHMPSISGLKSLKINDQIMGGQREDGDISFQLMGKNEETLSKAKQALKDKLNSIKGVGDVNDSEQSNRQEIQLELKPIAYSLSLDLATVASQVNSSFYGLEVQRILRDGEEVKVMVRYPKNQRSDIGHVAKTMIRLPNGAEVPLSEIANLTITTSKEAIRREDGQPTTNVWASVNSAIAEPQKIAKDIEDNFIPELTEKYPDVSSNLAGKIQDELDSQTEQLRNFVLSMLIVYALLAIPLRSYAQPLMIMSVIPFSILGAIYGHIILGMDVSSFSLFGIIAAAGVVINDSLVMVDYINKAKDSGMKVLDAVMEAGQKRFRAILLTSLTTFIGLTPIMLETSLQAKIVIPMAVSLAFGVLFATVITLIMIPCLYMMGEDIQQRRARKKQEKLEKKAQASTS